MLFFLQNNGQVDRADPQEGQPQRPASRFESFVSVVKTLIFRALIIYFITNLFKGKTPTPSTNSTQSGQARLPASNIYRNGTMFVSAVNSTFHRYRLKPSTIHTCMVEA